MSYQVLKKINTDAIYTKIKFIFPKEYGTIRKKAEVEPKRMIRSSSTDRFLKNHYIRWCKYNTIMLQQRNKLSNIQDWIQEILKYKQETAVLHEFVNWDVPKFPVSGGMLKEQGVPMDRNTAFVIYKLKEYWIENDCAVSAENLLEHVPNVLEDIKNHPPSSPKQTKKKLKKL